MTTITSTMYKNSPKVEQLLAKLLKRQESEQKRKTKINNRIKMRKSQTITKQNGRAAMVDQKVKRYRKKQSIAIAASPKLNKKIAVHIDAKTTIFIDKGKDPVAARENYIKNHQIFAV